MAQAIILTAKQEYFFSDDAVHSAGFIIKAVAAVVHNSNGDQIIAELEVISKIKVFDWFDAPIRVDFMAIAILTAKQYSGLQLMVAD